MCLSYLIENVYIYIYIYIYIYMCVCVCVCFILWWSDPPLLNKIDLNIYMICVMQLPKQNTITDKLVSILLIFAKSFCIKISAELFFYVICSIIVWRLSAN